MMRHVFSVDEHEKLQMNDLANLRCHHTEVFLLDLDSTLVDW